MDINEATDYTDNFYALVANQDFQNASNYFGGPLTQNEGYGLLIKINSLVGNLVSAEMSKIETSVKTADDRVEKTYIVEVNIKYEKDSCHEILNIKNINDSLKIYAYNSLVVTK